MVNIDPVIVYDSKEFLDVVDEHDKPLGFTKLRTEIHRDGDWHREVHVWVYNGKGELLLQLRGPNQETFPNCWDVSVGGHVEAGSDYLPSALKELREEIGLKAKSAGLVEIDYRHKEMKDDVRHLINRAHRKICVFRYDGNVADLEVEEGTIAAMKFFTEAEAMKISDDYGNGISVIPGAKQYMKEVFGKIREIMETQLSGKNKEKN